MQIETIKSIRIPYMCSYVRKTAEEYIHASQPTVLQANTANSSHRKTIGNYANNHLSNIVIPIIMQDTKIHQHACPFEWNHLNILYSLRIGTTFAYWRISTMESSV